MSGAMLPSVVLLRRSVKALEDQAEVLNAKLPAIKEKVEMGADVTTGRLGVRVK